MGLWKDRRAAFKVCIRPGYKRQAIFAGVGFLLLVVLVGVRPAAARVSASIVVDAQTGQVLLARRPDARAHPASLTKLMTLYLTFERLRDGKLSLDQRLRVSRHAASQQPTKLYLQAGSEISVQSAILGIVTESANDAAVVLAEGIGGSERKFARLMNAKARELGMTRTSFYNASGLPNRRQWTTARDMSRLAMALLHDYPDYYHFFGVRAFEFHGRTVYGHDYLLERYPGTDGLKTGYIHSAGFNLVTSVVRENRRLVGVVLGGRTARARDNEMISLLNRGFEEPATRVRRARTVSHSREERHAVQVRRTSAEVQLNDDADEADGQTWVVQVGGNFHSAHSVRRVLQSALRSAPEQLKPGKRLVVKLRGRRYRARFSRLSRERAMNACRRLDRKGYTCSVMNNGPSTLDLADAETSTQGQSQSN
jgi:D-alanyl-D-alanine carboxypeptidase